MKKCNSHGGYTGDICPGCLKVAAPDLLKMLEKTLKLLLDNAFDPEIQSVANEAKALIAKAKGDS